MQRLVQMGLPKPRDEYWRYTDPKLFNADAHAAIEIDEREPQLEHVVLAVPARAGASSCTRPGNQMRA